MTSAVNIRPQSVPHPYTVNLGTTHVVEVKNGGLYVGIYALTKSNRRRGVILPFGVWLTLVESIDQINGAIDRARGFALGTAESITSYGHMIRNGNEWSTITYPTEGAVFGYHPEALTYGEGADATINNFFQYAESTIKNECPDQLGEFTIKSEFPVNKGECNIQTDHPVQPASHVQKEFDIWQGTGPHESGQDACGQARV
jgi:hypothetical protein